ncbi:MAG TPA: SpoIIE family protein phosphatase [Terriglobia bacterium]|nr:SpoIIE family protein phosphatase [Terriglobia bacterium]
MPETIRSQARPLELTELLTLLLEVSEQIASTLDLDELMDRMAAIVKRAIDYEVFAILLLNDKTQELSIRFSSGHPTEVVQKLRVKVGEGIVGRAAATRKSVLVNDVHKDPHYIASLPSVRSELAVPLLAKNRVVGVIDLEAPWPDFFTERHQNLLELLAGRMALAVLNARLYRRTLRQAKTLQLLNEISRELSSVLVLKDLLRRIGTLTKRLIDYHRFSILLLDEHSHTLNTVISVKEEERTPDKVTVALDRGIVGAAARDQKPILVPDVTRDERYIATNPDTRSELAVPLIHRDKVIGVADLESPLPAHFTEDHAKLLSTLAPQIAIAIENSRLYERVLQSEARRERDLQRARDIQRHMLPALSPSIPGLEVRARFLPAVELGGDLFDFLAYSKERHAITIGDVSGKGAPAALYGAMASGILRSLAREKLAPPEMLQKLNVALLERKIEGHFITLTYAVWEPKTKTLRLANAGMPQPLLLHHDQARSIRVEGIPLGLLSNTEYQETTLQLESGDVMAMFSDGLAEATNPELEEFGIRRLEAILRGCAGCPLDQILETIYSEVARFEAGRSRKDDQTLVLFRVK